MPMPAENTVKDCFCGAGGSSTGAEMGGGEVVFALNHSELRPERSPFLTLRASRISPRC